MTGDLTRPQVETLTDLERCVAHIETVPAQDGIIIAVTFDACRRRADTYRIHPSGLLTASPDPGPDIDIARRTPCPT